jgi:hypothetical protein
MPLPKADVIVMVPVGMAHVGCVVTLAVGVAGAEELLNGMVSHSL